MTRRATWASRSSSPPPTRAALRDAVGDLLARETGLDEEFLVALRRPAVDAGQAAAGAELGPAG